MDTARMTTRCSSRVALWHRYTILYLLCSAVRSTAIDISNALLTRVLRDSYRDNRLNKAHSPLPFGLGIGVGYLQEQRSHRCSRHSTTTMRPFTACISTPFQAAGSSGRACRPSSLPSGRILRHAVHRCAAAEGTETNTAPSVMEWDIVMFSASINAGTHRLGRVSRIESNGMLEVEPMIEQDPGVWLLDEEVSDPCVVHGEEIVKTVDAEYGQRVVEDRVSNPHGEHAEEVWEIAEGDVPESVFRGGASSIGE